MILNFPQDMRETTYSRKKIFQYNARQFCRRFTILFAFALLFPLGGTFMDYGLTLLDNPWPIVRNCGISLLLALIIVGFMLFAIHRWIMRDKSFDVPHQFGFDENAAYFSCSLFQTGIRWEFFNSWGENRDYILLQGTRNRILWPKSPWSTAELETIRTYLQQQAHPRKIWLRNR